MTFASHYTTQDKNQPHYQLSSALFLYGIYHFQQYTFTHCFIFAEIVFLKGFSFFLSTMSLRYRKEKNNIYIYIIYIYTVYCT